MFHLFRYYLCIKNHLRLRIAYLLFNVFQVDAHNIVPVWVASEKKEYAARTIRRKINDKLDKYLTEFPPVIKHPLKSTFKAEVSAREILEMRIRKRLIETRFHVTAYRLGKR